MTAIGIHAHPTRKLGRRQPCNKPALRFADHLAAIPAAPIVDTAPALTWPMDENDQWGDCVVAAGDHALQAIETALAGGYVNMTRDEILAAYRTQNPGFDPADPAHGAGSSDDGGMDVQTFLAWLVKQGKILAFAKVDHTNPDEMRAAIWLGLGIVTGESLTVAQQSQQVWDPVPGDRPWGGHATTTVGYPGPAQETEVSWGRLYGMTEAFVAQSVEEAWFVLAQAHVDHPGFRGYVDLASFAAAFTAITGRPFPVPVPGPAPTPGADADATLAAAAKPWCAANHRGPNHVMQLALQRWMAAKGL